MEQKTPQELLRADIELVYEDLDLFDQVKKIGRIIDTAVAQRHVAYVDYSKLSLGVGFSPCMNFLLRL